MAIEKSWSQVGPLLLTANGDAEGTVIVLSTKDLYVKQQVILKSSTKLLQLEIKSVLSEQILKVGPKGGSLENYSDISEFLVSEGAQIYAEKQSRPSIPQIQHDRAVFAEEPIVAVRSILVDHLGRYFSKDNPLPVDVELVVDDVTVNVDLDAFGPDPDSVLSVGSEDGTASGTKHVFKVDSNKKLHVKDEDAVSAISDVKDAIDSGNQDVVNALSTVNQSLDDVNQSVQEGNLLLDSLDTKATATNQALDSIDQGIDAANQNLQDIEQQLADIESAVSKSIKARILESDDRLRTVNYADFGNINQRITSLVFTSSSVPGYVLTRTFNFVLDQGRYKRTTDQWSLQTV